MKAGVTKIAEGAVQARQRIEQFVYQTPLLHSRELGKLYGSDLRFKAENFQHTGSFKMRGAASKMTSLTDKQRSYNGVFRQPWYRVCQGGFDCWLGFGGGSTRKCSRSKT